MTTLRTIMLGLAAAVSIAGPAGSAHAATLYQGGVPGGLPAITPSTPQHPQAVNPCQAYLNRYHETGSPWALHSYRKCMQKRFQ
jgi:hypothetical protein